MGKITTSEEGVTPNTPSVGRRTLYPKSDGWYELDDQGVETKLYTSSVFGQDFLEASRSTSETNGDAVFDTYLSVTQTHSTIGAKYRIGVTVAWGMNTGSRNIQVAVVHDGNQLGVLEVEAKDTGAEIRNWNTGFFYVTETTNIAHPIEIQYRPEDSRDTATMYYAGIEIWRVS